MSKTIQEIEKILDTPLTPYDVEWKPFDAKNKKWARYAPYIDARAVRRLLDLAFTRWGWGADYVPLADGFLCTIHVNVEIREEQPVDLLSEAIPVETKPKKGKAAEKTPDDILHEARQQPMQLIQTKRLQISKQDGANRTSIEPVKGGISDALKRAASALGIGASLYEFPKLSCAMVDKNGAEVASADYKILDWAQPQLDLLVDAWGRGWRPSQDQYWLKPNSKPAWADFKDVKPVPRSTEPELEPAPPAPVDAPKPLTKAEQADLMGEMQHIQANINSSLTPEEFDGVYDMVSANDKMTGDAKKTLMKQAFAQAKKFEVVWLGKDVLKFGEAPQQPLTPEGEETIAVWKESIDAVEVINDLEGLYDDFVTSDLLRNHLLQYFIRVAREKGFVISPGGKKSLLELLAF